MPKSYLRILLSATSSLVALTCAHGALAADQAAAPSSMPTPTMTGAGAEGTDVSTIVVTAEANRAAAQAPAKASLD